MKKSFRTIPIAVLLLALALSVCGCKKQGKPTDDTAAKPTDITVTARDHGGKVLAGAEITVAGLSNYDITDIFTADAEGRFTMKGVRVDKLSFYLHTAEGSYRIDDRTITREELASGEMEIVFPEESY
ncbi:MAG: hypothetical protein J5586_01470 [Clostridia bacterium]|nr:hypothetical protein [Clostridia bacterium]